MSAQKSANESFNWLKEIVLAISLNSIWVLMALLAVWLGWRNYTLSVNGNRVEGTVVRWLEDDKAAFDSDFIPIVEFQVDDITYTIQSQNSYRWWNRYTRFSIGKQVQILYDPANPKSGEINSWLDIWMEPLLLGAFTIIFAITISMYILFRWRRGRNLQVST